MSKQAEELAQELFPYPKIEDYDDILVYRADRDNAIIGRANAVLIYEQAEKELILLINRLCEAILFEWKDAADLARKTLLQIKEREEEQ